MRPVRRCIARRDHALDLSRRRANRPAPRLASAQVTPQKQAFRLAGNGVVVSQQQAAKGGGPERSAKLIQHARLISSRNDAEAERSNPRVVSLPSLESATFHGRSLSSTAQGLAAPRSVCLSGQRERDHPSYARLMRSQYLKFTIAAVWMMLAVALVAALGYLRSPSDVLMLAVLALAPPAAMWLWWNYPAETTSESIHAARENEAGKTTGRQAP